MYKRWNWVHEDVKVCLLGVFDTVGASGRRVGRPGYLRLLAHQPGC